MELFTESTCYEAAPFISIGSGQRPLLQVITKSESDIRAQSLLVTAAPYNIQVGGIRISAIGGHRGVRYSGGLDNGPLPGRHLICVLWLVGTFRRCRGGQHQRPPRGGHHRQPRGGHQWQSRGGHHRQLLGVVVSVLSLFCKI